MASGSGATVVPSSPQPRGLSPPPRLDRPLSRPSSRNSVRSARAGSPSVPYDDPVAVRNQISTLKHNIRHQQAQLHDLEDIILRGPRPYSNDITADMSVNYGVNSFPPTSFTLHHQHSNSSPSPTSKLGKRPSYEVLQGLAGSDSGLPLPRRMLETNGLDADGGIKEGIPTSFVVGQASPSYRRNSSPSRSLSRIPISSVGNARALADEGRAPTSPLAASTSKQLPAIDSELAQNTSSASLSVPPPPSPNNLSKRASLTPGGTTKVLADLQAGVINARNALDNTKAQLRLSQRSVAQLTRQTEDLKEGRERLRLENEGLNNVVARKERLLQEVLDRARKAEAETAALKTQFKSETSSSKKALREMEATLSESTALSQRSEREYITLRDSIKGLTESWKQDTERLREEMRKREDRWKRETEQIAEKYKILLQEVQLSRVDMDEIRRLKEENKETEVKVEQAWKDDIEALKVEIERSSEEGHQAAETAKQVAAELARLRRLMRNASQDGSSEPKSPPPIPLS